MKLTIIHPDDIDNQFAIEKNMPFDESLDFEKADYISSVSTYDDEIKDDDINNKFPPIPPSKEEENDQNINFKGINLGNGKMDYIKHKNDKLMMTNAWQAITQTNNWEFVSKDVESFMMSNDDRIYIITDKMEKLGYDGHSGSSFGSTMRYMQFLARKGEEEFKKLFEKSKMD